MKPLRILLIGLAALVVLVTIAVALAFTSGVQTWAAHKFAPATPELSVAIGQVDAGLKQTRVEDVRVVQPGLSLTLPSAEIDVSVLDAAGGKVAVRRLVAKGWVLDLTAPATGAAPAAESKPAQSPADATRSAFEGIFKLIELPVDLAVDGVDLAGEVILPEGRMQVSITGGGLASGREGSFTLTTNVQTTDSSVAVQGLLGARMNSPRTFDRFSFVADALAKSPQVPQGAKASFTLNATTDGQNESFTFGLRAGEREILRAAFTLPPGTAPLTGTWNLDATTADAAPFALGQPLPDFVAKGQGTFTADRTFSQITAAGNLDASVEKLSVLDPGLTELGRLTLAAGFDVATQGDTVLVNKLDARIAGAAPIASVTSLQAIQFNPATGAVTAPNPSAELLRVTLDGLPVTWANPFLGDLSLIGDNLRGAFAVTVLDGGFALRPAAPITLTNFSVAQDGQLLLRGLNVSLSAQADYTPQGFNAEVTNLSVLSGGAMLVKVTARAAQATGDRQPLTASGTYEASLPAVLAQPVAAGSVGLLRGVARGDFNASVLEATTASLTLQLAELVASDGTALPAVALQGRADIAADGQITAQLPIVITQATRRSDLALAAVVKPTEKNTDIQARLTSDSLNVPDLMLFAGLAPKSATAPAAPAPLPAPTIPTPGAPTTPAGPLWAGVTGDLVLSLKTVVYSPEVQVNNVEGAVKITPAALTLQNLQAALKTGGNLKASGGLEFDAKEKQPYALKADVALIAIEPAPILAAFSPGNPSPVDGKFDLTTQLAGRATDPAGFTDTVLGDIKLTGKDGTLKALSIKSSSVVSGASKVASVVGLLGSALGQPDVAKYANRSRAGADVIQQLGALQFDQFNMVLSRDEQNNLGIKDLTMISPIIRLVGSGTIAYQPGVPLMQQPLLMTLKLGAKGTLAENLRALNLIETEANATDYSYLADDIKLDGSLQSIGTSQLSNMITRALTK